MFCNWSGNVRFSPETIISPRSVQDIQDLVKHARVTNRTVRVVGAAHSFSGLIVTPDTLVRLDKMRGLIEVDRASNTATFWAGTGISEIGPLLKPHGLALSNQGDIDYQALAGAMSTGTHGTGLEFASLAGFMTKLEFVDGKGEIQTIDESTPGDLLNAARVSLGMFGIFTKITVRCIPSFILRDRREKTLLETCLIELPEKIRDNRHYEFFWFPYSPHAQVKICNPTPAKNPRNPVVKFFADDVLERALYGAICEVTNLLPKLSKATSRLCGELMPTADYSNVAYKVYPSSRHVRFTEMEYSLPLEAGVACFREIKDFIEREKIEVFFPVEFRVAGADPAWVSSMTGRQNAIISLHVYKGIDQERYFSGAERIFKKHGGRPHWGKVHTLTFDEIKNMYPRWSEFLKVRKIFDPDGVFLNEMLRPYTTSIEEPYVTNQSN